MSAAGWCLPAFASRDRSLDLAALKLAAEFDQFDIGVCETHQGRSLVALRRGGTSGLTAVITPDPDEMRKALLEDSPPLGSGPP